jgi:peptidoglycan/LPS O-acetylase OafA/YrhL
MRRITSLDGLRGIAALVVVFEHIALVHPTLVLTMERPPAYPPPGAWEWWLTATPLHLGWAGGEAVLIFFVLSGLVLVLPVTRRTRPSVDWSVYYARRIVRLFLPVFGALALAVPLMLVFGRPAIEGASWWNHLDHPPFDLSPASVLAEASLLLTPGRVIPPLWSLKWEVLFSLLLPAFLLIPRFGRRWPIVMLLAILGAQGVGVYTGNAWLTFLPVFALGCLLAASERRLEEVCDRMRTWQWTFVAVAAVGCLLNKWLIGGVPALDGLSERGRFPSLATVPTSFGAMLVVLLGWQWQPFARALDRGPVQWLGTRSYSLYLVHFPIVVVVATAFTGWSPWSVPIVVIGSLLAAHFFHRFVEAPSVDLSRRTGQWVTSRRGRGVAPPGAPVPQAEALAAGESNAVPSDGDRAWSLDPELGRVVHPSDPDPPDP